MPMVLFFPFILVYFMPSNGKWINSKFERFYCMSSKWDGRKTEGITGNISQAFGQETANEHTSQHVLKEFCNGDETLKVEKDRRRPSAIDDNQLRVIIEGDPSKTT
jgi:hypothetical protein